MSEWIPLTTRPQTISQLCLATGSPRREIEAGIQQMRRDGVPVVSDGQGIRLARDAADAERCAARLRSRALEQMATARALLDTAERMAIEEAGHQAEPIQLQAFPAPATVGP